MSLLTRLVHHRSGLDFNADPELLLDYPYGSALPTLATHDGKPIACLMLRERAERIPALADESAEVRSFGVEAGGVVLVVILVRLGEQIFETWWNWHNTVLRPMMERLFEQDELLVAFFTDTPHPVVVRQYAWAGVRDSLRPVRARLEGSTPWSMPAFDEARSAVCADYPTPMQLWLGLGS